MKAKHRKDLISELARLAEASNAASFDVTLDMGALTDDAREAARLVNKILENYQNAFEDELMKYRLASSALGIAHWDMALDDSDDSPVNPDNVFSWSPEFRRMLGFSDERDFPDVLSSWSSRLHPADKGRVLKALEAHIADRSGQTPYSQEYRLKMKNGKYRYFRAVGMTSRDKAGRPLRVAGALKDISARKRMQEQIDRHDKLLADQAYWYKSILDAMPLPLSVADADMNLTFTNTAAEKFFGKKREDLLGRPCSCWNSPICGTDNCSIVRAKRGLMRTPFKDNGVSCQVATEIIRDVAGKTLGFLEVLHDVTEIEKAARWQADEANEAKSAFLATISHEMRTPLNTVIGLSELTLDSGELHAEAEANIENIYNAGSTLLSIVNDILDLSKITSDKFKITPCEYDVPSMVNDVIAQVPLHIGNKPVRFILTIGENMPARLYGDDLRVKQIILNLLSNAFKYTEKGKVEFGLSCEREDGAVGMTIRVSDTGVGIRPEHHARLFSDYAQLDVKASRLVGGTGLGLSITKNLAEMMGGQITLESTYGKGSVFTVNIRQGFVGDAVIGAELAESLRSFRYAANRRRRHARLNRVWLPYARVLVVDDHRINLDVAKGLMRPYGMHIDCVTSGQEAIDAISDLTLRYDAVFMDHMMPGMDGVEAVRRIRKLGSLYAENIPIIALTANAVVGSEEMFLRNGFSAFLSKPIEIARLDEQIQRFVRDKKLEALLGEDSRSESHERQGRDRRKGQDRRQGRDRRHVRDRREENGRRVAGGEGASALLACGNKLEGLDISRGLEIFGDEESFLRVLRSYAANTKALLESIGVVQRENLPGYAITVHGIKGSSRGICAYQAGNLAEALEDAAKSGNFDFVRETHPVFLEQTWRLISSIETVLADMAKDRRRPKRDKPDEGLLSRLHAACAAYDMDGIDAAVAEIAAFEYESDPGFVEWLQANVTRMNFAQIQERIAASRAGVSGRGSV